MSVTTSNSSDAAVVRCTWARSDPLYLDYHDTEWGQPLTGDIALFERISLEGFQSGLSWITILRKRPAFRAAFADFDFDEIAAFRPADVERLLADPGIVRHRGKIEAVIDNAKRAIELRDEAGSLELSFGAMNPNPRRLTRKFAPSLPNLAPCPKN